MRLARLLLHSSLLELAHYRTSQMMPICGACGAAWDDDLCTVGYAAQGSVRYRYCAFIELRYGFGVYLG